MHTTRRSKWLLIVGAVSLLPTLIVAAVVFSAKQQEPKKPRKQWLTVIPPLDSKIKDLEIINARLVRQDTDSPAIAFDVWNKSNRGVMALEIACGRGSIAKDGLEDDQNPIVIIEPHGTLAVEMNDELSPGYPIVITAAVFDDKKEEGQQSSLDLMHKVRLRQRALLKARQAQPVHQRSPNQ